METRMKRRLRSRKSAIMWGVWAVLALLLIQQAFPAGAAPLQTPAEAIEDLIDTVESFNLQRGIENSLNAKLDAARDDLNRGNDGAAINVLQAFINSVEAQRGKKLTDAQADELVNAAQGIIATLQQTCVSSRSTLTDTGSFGGTATITTPADCTTGFLAATGINMSGTYSGLPEDAKIWVLVYPPNNRYYPQSSDACAGAAPEFNNGNWSVTIFLGEAGGEPEWFDVVVIFADEATGQFLSDRLQTGCQSGFPGLTAAQLEEHTLTEKAFITVQTQD